HHGGRAGLTRPAGVIAVLVIVQVTLGALTVLTRRDVWINSVHLVCGALVLATSIVMALRAWRVRFSLVDRGIDQTRELTDQPAQPAQIPAAQTAVEPSEARA